MKQTRPGVQSTLVKDIVWGRKKNSDLDGDEPPKEQRDIYVKTYFSKDTIYTK